MMRLTDICLQSTCVEYKGVDVSGTCGLSVLMYANVTQQPHAV